MGRSLSGRRRPPPAALAVMAGLVAVVVGAGLAQRTAATAQRAGGTAQRAGGTAQRAAGTADSQPVSLSSLYWIYYKEDLSRLQPMDPSLIAQTLSGPGSYVLEHNAGGNPLPAGVIPVQLFFSYADEQTALANGGILPGVQSLAYDPEDWPATPVAEQQRPVTYLQKFATAAKANGDQTVLIPGRDLMQVRGAACTQQRGATLSQAYLSCNLPATAAYANIYVIQSAAVETNLPALTELVKQAAAQARAANQNVIILATLTTTISGTAISGSALNQAARAVIPYVQGLELNTTASTDGRIITFLHDLSGN